MRAQVMQEPRIFVLHNLLSAAEAEEMIRLGISVGMGKDTRVPDVTFVDSIPPPLTMRSHLAATLDRTQSPLVSALLSGVLIPAYVYPCFPLLLRASATLGRV